MEMPQPGPEHEKLHAMVGEWVGDDTLFPSSWSPEEQHRKCKLSVRSLDNFFVISDFEQTVDSQVTFRGHGVYSWDPQAEVFKMYWFDSMGGAGGLADGRMEGNVLTFQNTSPMGHHRYRYTFNPDETIFEMAGSQDGEDWQTMMEGHYRKVD